MLRRQQPPIRIYVCSHTLPVSRRGFASVVQQGNSLLETAPGWPGEGLSSSLKTSHRAAGTCQDGCYLAKQRDPCLPASTVENRGERGCCSQSGPLLMSLRVPAWRVKPQLWAVPREWRSPLPGGLTQAHLKVIGSAGCWPVRLGQLFTGPA